MCKILFSRSNSEFHVGPSLYKKTGRMFLVGLETIAMISLGHKAYLNREHWRVITAIQLPKTENLLKAGFVVFAICVLLLFRNYHLKKHAKKEDASKIDLAKTSKSDISSNIKSPAQIEQPAVSIIRTPIADSFTQLPKVRRVASPPRTPTGDKENCKPRSPSKILPPGTPKKIAALVASKQRRLSTSVPTFIQTPPSTPSKDSEGFSIPQPVNRKPLNPIDVQTALKADTAGLARQGHSTPNRPSVFGVGSPKTPGSPASPLLDKIAKLQARRNSQPHLSKH